MADIEEIQRRILLTDEFEGTVGEYDWKGFEDIVAGIFACHGYRVRKNFRFKTDRRWENDVMATDGRYVFCVDCKRWSEGRSKKWSVVRAAKEQKSRTKSLNRFVKRNPIARSLLEVPDAEFVPMVVTLHQEDASFEGVHVVPVRKLNSFILGYRYII